MISDWVRTTRRFGYKYTVGFATYIADGYTCREILPCLLIEVCTWNRVTQVNCPYSTLVSSMIVIIFTESTNQIIPLHQKTKKYDIRNWFPRFQPKLIDSIINRHSKKPVNNRFFILRGSLMHWLRQALLDAALSKN